jgi:hypothetical protein
MNKKIKILYLAADPMNISLRPRLGGEVRDIYNKIKIATNRDLFEMNVQWVVRPGDLVKALLTVRPNIVHLTGHGTNEPGIYLEDDAGKKKQVSGQALADLFQQFKGDVRIILLNNCYTESLAKSLNQVVDFVVGTNTELGQESALSFIGPFYRALAYGYSVDTAFKLAQNKLCLDDIPDSNTPILWVRKGVDSTLSFITKLSKARISPIRRKSLDKNVKDQSKRALRVFLCHSSHDKKIVRVLFRRLCMEGIDPWLDEEKLLAGQDWEYEITKAVGGADVVLVCLSSRAITKKGYIHKEIRYALDRADEQPEGAIFLIPVRLEECDVPERLKRWHWINFFETEGYEKLMLALGARAGALGLTLRKKRIKA